jgi:hypothetical protein
MIKTWPLFNRLVAIAGATLGLIACGGGSGGNNSENSDGTDTATPTVTAALNVSSHHADSGVATLVVDFTTNQANSQPQLIIEEVSSQNTLVNEALPLDCSPDCSATWRGLIDTSGQWRVQVDFQDDNQSALNILREVPLELGECLRNHTFYLHHVQPELQQNCISCHGLGSQGVFDPRWEWSQFSQLINDYGEWLHEFPSQNTSYNLLGEVHRHPLEALPEDQPGYYALMHLVQRQQQGFDCP